MYVSRHWCSKATADSTAVDRVSKELAYIVHQKHVSECRSFTICHGLLCAVANVVDNHRGSIFMPEKLGRGKSPSLT